MPFAAGLSQHPVAAEAAGEVIGQVLERIGPEPDLAALFVTAPLTGAVEDVAATVRSVLRPRRLIGATAVSVLAGEHEVEETSAVALWAGRLRRREGTGRPEPVQALRLEAEPVEDGWYLRGLPPPRAEPSTLVLLADPFSFPVEGVLGQLRQDQPAMTVVGGLASAARGPGGNRLVLDHELHADGAVGLWIDGEQPVEPVVSQGCRPIGEPMVVTRAERNVLYELAGRPALERLMALIGQVSPEERALLQRGLHLGTVVDERQATFSRGDFLIRNVLGAEREAGSIAVGDVVDVGSTVQFQVRDAASADEDLRALVARAGDAAGALVFTCNGRGTHLFGRPHHDAEIVSGVVDGRACAGMFCAGELGPVGGRSFLHGFTASVALFRD
jgi:small ligand-binding sensory domain FIST